MRTPATKWILPVVALVILASCGTDSNASTEQTNAPAIAATEPAGSVDASGLRLVTATEGAAIQSNPPDGLVILDVRTIEEFETAHLEGASMLDFYRADFEDRLGELDRDVPYLIYCRSGNRSGQTLAIMERLGFTNVADVDGGILAWDQAGLATTTS